MKLNKVYFPLIFAIAIAFGILIGGKINGNSKNNFFTNNSKKNKLNHLIDLIDNEYVDSINTDSIVDLTVNGILEKLDPHSVYIPKNEIELVAQSMKGEFVGIGINYYMYKDTLAVIKPIPFGPSDKAGLKAGDRILFADKLQLFNKKLPSDSLMSVLKGEKGTDVKLTVFRKSENKKFALNIKRNVVPIKSVDVATMVSKTTGYIKINRFAETTISEFKKGLQLLKQKGATSLILDLRDNGGGYLDAAVTIADDFLPEKALIVKTKNKQDKMETKSATKNGAFENGKLFILINENSASASEVLAGAIQDNDRGTIIGRRSFGKGLVQREMPLGDGSAVRLTIARYYTPSGRSIQKPYLDKKENYFNEFEKRFESGELYEKDKTKIADSLKFKTKNGRIVFGGGGIIPDLFVPFEASHGEEAVTLFLQSGMLNYFVFEQLDKNRIRYKKMTKIQLETEIYENPNYFSNFKKYLSENGLFLSLDKQKSTVLHHLHAAFAEQLFQDDYHFQLLLQQDKMIEKALSN